MDLIQPYLEILIPSNVKGLLLKSKVHNRWNYIFSSLKVIEVACHRYSFENVKVQKILKQYDLLALLIGDGVIFLDMILAILKTLFMFIY